MGSGRSLIQILSRQLRRETVGHCGNLIEDSHSLGQDSKEHSPNTSQNVTNRPTSSISLLSIIVFFFSIRHSFIILLFEAIYIYSCTFDNVASISSNNSFIILISQTGDYIVIHTVCSIPVCPLKGRSHPNNSLSFFN